MSAASDRGGRGARAVWLARVASTRPGVVQRVARSFGSLDAALDASLSSLRTLLAPRSAGAPDEAPREASRYAAALAAQAQAPASCSTAGRLLVTYDDELYPPGLRSLFDPPPVLFVAGADPRPRLRALARAPAVAVVGTRAPSSYGLEMARLLGGDLARAGVVVVSGVALGVDVAAQLAALAAVPLDPVGDTEGVPRSVGVLGSGLDIVHPRSNAAAFRALREHGLLVSEFWPGTPPSVWRFPARNRLIAGLSRAVVVVEGSRRSGSRITAELALDAGREVLAVPGEAGRRLSEAPHHLLRHGAQLCEAADDVLVALGLERLSARAPADAGGAAPGDCASGPEATDGDGPGAEARAVLATLRDAPGTAEEVAARAGLAPRAASAALSALEVEGLAERADGGVYRLAR